MPDITIAQLEEIAFASLATAEFDVEIFAQRMLKQIQTLQEAGMSAEAIALSLENDMIAGGRIFGELRNAVKATMVLGISEAARLGQYSNYDLDKGQFTWITVSTLNICPDCSARGGDVGTFNYHESKGLPGSGWSVCKAYCYCVLDPSGEIPNKFSRADVQEKNFST